MNQGKNIRNMPQKVFAISTRKNGKKYFKKLKKIKLSSAKNKAPTGT